MKYIFEVQFVINLMGNDKTHETTRVIELDEKINLISTFERMHEHAFLKFVTAKHLKVPP